jgi:hypothetical protein
VFYLKDARKESVFVVVGVVPVVKVVGYPTTGTTQTT